jgi:hypothetical protein
MAKDFATAIPRDGVAICEAACKAAHDLVLAVADVFR